MRLPYPRRGQRVRFPIPRRFRHKLIALIIACISFAGGFLFYKGKVVHVADGDTITVLMDNGPVTVRLYGVDCPEKRQQGGEAATAFVRETLLFSPVSLSVMSTDQYGRTIAVVHLPDGKTLNEELVRAGHAWVYRSLCRAPMCLQWITQENQAKKQKLGLWQQARPVPPWQWRRTQGK